MRWALILLLLGCSDVAWTPLGNHDPVGWPAQPPISAEGIQLPQLSHLKFSTSLLTSTLNAEIGTDTAVVWKRSTYGDTNSEHATAAYCPTGKAHDAISLFLAGVKRTNCFSYKDLTNFPGGAYSGGSVKNWILQSEAPATTWALIAGGSANNNVVGQTTPWGTSTVGSIVCAGSGDGVRQVSGITTAAGKAVVGSVYVKTVSGTLNGNLTVLGSSGGTPEAKSEPFTATTEWYRAPVYNTFTGSATGDVEMRVSCTGAGTLLVAGFQIEDILTDYGVDGDDEALSYLKVPRTYVPTTTTYKTFGEDQINYNVSNITSMTKGTVTLWTQQEWGSSDIHPSGSKSAFNLDTPAWLVNLMFNYQGHPIIMNLNQRRIYSDTEVIERGQVNHWGCVFDYDAQDFRLYRNGALMVTDVAGTTAIAPSSISVFNVGGQFNYLSNGYRQFDGVLNNFHYWDVPLTDEEVAEVFALENVN